MSAATTPDLFDDFGRCLPTQVTAPALRAVRRYFHCLQPALDYEGIHARLARHLDAGTSMNAQEFRQRAEAILQRVEAAPATRKLARGVAVPFIVPALAAGDLGADLDERFLPAVANAFHERFPAYRFTNHHKTGLCGRLSVRTGSRHQHLLDTAAACEVVGIYFPCFDGYSIPAAVEQLAALPEDFVLAGGYDTGAALTGSPDLLLRTDGYPPLLWLGALEGEQEGIGYHFEAYGYNLTFNRRPHLGQAAEYWSAGLTVLESRDPPAPT